MATIRRLFIFIVTMVTAQVMLAQNHDDWIKTVYDIGAEITLNCSKLTLLRSIVKSN